MLLLPREGFLAQTTSSRKGLTMDVEIKREAAFAGQRVKQKVVFALALCSVIPLLVLTYVIHGHLVPGFESAAPGMTNVLAIPTLVAFTGLLMAGGGYVVWDLASAVSRAASLVSTAQPAGQTTGARSDEIGTLVTSFNRMMATIEQQAEEISQFPRRLEQLTKQAFRDSLTGVPNRALFMDRLSHGLTRARRRHEHVAVLFLDLDRFKVINDTLGHAVGDQLLVEVSNRLGSSLRPGDTVARLGGDEFGLLLEDVADGETAEAVALRIEAELAKPLHFEGREIFITASIGIALSSARLGMPEEILRDADLAMYHAKAKGKARHEIFDDSMSAPALESMESVVMHDAPATLAKLKELKDLGIRLAIDDFGTGYSSLGYLKRFPVDTLKIDRSFVKGIGDDVEDSAIVRAVITVAKSLSLSVTAEGIETAEQLEHLRALGCDHGQGYFFAKPMASERVPALLLATSPW